MDIRKIKKLIELVEESGDTLFEYANLPVANLDNIIIDFKEIHS